MAGGCYSRCCSKFSKKSKKSLRAFEKWLTNIRQDPTGLGVDGVQLLANLKSESHLTGDSNFNHIDELAAFIKQCVNNHAKSKEEMERLQAYASSCANYRTRGFPIENDWLPPVLLRYCTSKYVVLILVARMLGPIARADLDNGRMTMEEAFSRIARNWDASKLTGTDMLSGGSAAWASFDHPAGAPRDDALRMANALALPVLLRLTSDEVILFEFTYSMNAVSGHRFPTVADAEYIYLFRPSPNIAPNPANPESCSGWTFPLNGESKQPELIHNNASLRVLTKCPRFIGRLN